MQVAQERQEAVCYIVVQRGTVCYSMLQCDGEGPKDTFSSRASRKFANNHVALLRKWTCRDKPCYGSWPLCHILQDGVDL